MVKRQRNITLLFLTFLHEFYFNLFPRNREFCDMLNSSHGAKIRVERVLMHHQRSLRARNFPIWAIFKLVVTLSAPFASASDWHTHFKARKIDWKMSLFAGNNYLFNACNQYMIAKCNYCKLCHVESYFCPYYK